MDKSFVAKPIQQIPTEPALAWMLLYDQEKAKNPTLTPDTFNAWMREQVKAKAKAARAAKEAKK